MLSDGVGSTIIAKLAEQNKHVLAMKFKGNISHEGMTALRKILSAIEKFGSRCYLLFSPSDLYLIQDTVEADGMQVSARIDSVSRLRSISDH